MGQKAGVVSLHMHKKFIGLAAIGALVIGSGYIVFTGRPIAKMQPTIAGGNADAATPYTMADVQSHGAPDSCWSTINGGVYDLTEWVSRHPGGQNAIMRLCGIDGSNRFNRQHSTFQQAIDTLALLKIGVLKQ